MYLVAKSKALSSTLVTTQTKTEAQTRWMSQKIIKCKILAEVDEASSALLRVRVPRQDLVVHGCELTDRLTAGLDAMFLHGLHDTEHQGKILWQLFEHCSPKSVTKEILATPYLTTDIGFCRAFTRDMLNTPGAPMGVLRVLVQEKKARRLVETMYADVAMVRDEEDLMKMMVKLDRLQEVLSFQLRLSHPKLNKWSGRSLQLTGSYGPSLPMSSLAAPVLATPPSLQELQLVKENKLPKLLSNTQKEAAETSERLLSAS